MKHILFAGAEMQTGIPTGIPGQPIIENALTKIGSADSVYAPLVICLIAVVALMGWLLRQVSKEKNALIERVVVVAEGYKVTQATMTTALDGMKGALAAMSQAVHDLAREAEAEAREGRHGIAQITQIVSHSAEQIRRLLDRVPRNDDRGRE
jgi:hypothetical protein